MHQSGDKYRCLLFGIFSCATFEDRAEFPDSEWAETCELTDAQLHVEEGTTHKCQHKNIRDKKSTCNHMGQR